MAASKRPPWRQRIGVGSPGVEALLLVITVACVAAPLVAFTNVEDAGEQIRDALVLYAGVRGCVVAALLCVQALRAVNMLGLAAVASAVALLYVLFVVRPSVVAVLKTAKPYIGERAAYMLKSGWPTVRLEGRRMLLVAAAVMATFWVGELLLLPFVTISRAIATAFAAVRSRCRRSPEV